MYFFLAHTYIRWQSVTGRSSATTSNSPKSSRFHIWTVLQRIVIRLSVACNFQSLPQQKYLDNNSKVFFQFSYNTWVHVAWQQLSVRPSISASVASSWQYVASAERFVKFEEPEALGLFNLKLGLDCCHLHCIPLSRSLSVRCLLWCILFAELSHSMPTSLAAVRCSLKPWLKTCMTVR